MNASNIVLPLTLRKALYKAARVEPSFLKVPISVVLTFYKRLVASRPLTERIDLLTSFVTQASLNTSVLFGSSSICSENPVFINSSGSTFEANLHEASLKS